MRRLAVVLAAALLGGCTASPRSVAPSLPPSVPPSPAASPAPGALAPPADGATVVAVLGDYGVDDLPVRRVVRLMGTFSGGPPLAAVVTTGDNAYQSGTRGQATFARRALQPLLGAGTRLLAALGNHDVRTARGAHVLSALGMPARWYTAVVGPVEFVFLDSTRTADPAQLAFLDRTLARRRTPFRVVVFHHPAASCSFHGPDAGVVRDFVPRLRGKVDLVLAGHNHTYERYAALVGGPAYVTTGGGGARLYPSLPGLCKGVARIAIFRTAYHAVRLVATARELLLEAVGVDGLVFDRLALSAPPGR